ncbi:MAG: hypothetical protein LUE14_08625 [Clostridiales bacterium]|nr:hypothetical protein [Clostridiales bacterium]
MKIFKCAWLTAVLSSEVVVDRETGKIVHKKSNLVVGYIEELPTQVKLYLEAPVLYTTDNRGIFRKQEQANDVLQYLNKANVVVSYKNIFLSIGNNNYIWLGERGSDHPCSLDLTIPLVMVKESAAKKDEAGVKK